MNTMDWPTATVVLGGILGACLTFIRLYSTSSNFKMNMVLEDLREIKNALKGSNGNIGIERRLDRVEFSQKECPARKKAGQAA